MVLNQIDPENKYIHHRLFRDSCLQINGNYVKDLSLLGRDIDKTIIIDNNLVAFALNLDNAIPIKSFAGDKTDTELDKLIEIVDYANNMGYMASSQSKKVELVDDPLNLREYLTSMFGLKERISFWRNHCQNQRESQVLNSS